MNLQPERPLLIRKGSSRIEHDGLKNNLHLCFPVTAPIQIHSQFPYTHGKFVQPIKASIKASLTILSIALYIMHKNFGKSHYDHCIKVLLKLEEKKFYDS